MIKQADSASLAQYQRPAQMGLLSKLPAQMGIQPSCQPEFPDVELRYSPEKD
jgi:hypothetical protein